MSDGEIILDPAVGLKGKDIIYVDAPVGEFTQFGIRSDHTGQGVFKLLSPLTGLNAFGRYLQHGEACRFVAISLDGIRHEHGGAVYDKNRNCLVVAERTFFDSEVWPSEGDQAKVYMVYELGCTVRHWRWSPPDD